MEICNTVCDALTSRLRADLSIVNRPPHHEAAQTVLYRRRPLVFGLIADYMLLLQIH